MDGNKRFMGTVILILQRIDVHDFHGGVPPGKLMERIRAFWGSFPSFLVFSISTSLIFSRPNAKGRCPPSFSLPEIVAHVSQKRPRTMDFISIAVCDLLYLVLQQTATFTSIIFYLYILDKVIRGINYRL